MKLICFQIWDTAGQERFKSLRTPFYRGSDLCLLVFSVGDKESFNNLSKWKDEFVHYADIRDPKNFPFVVLGNKVKNKSIALIKRLIVVYLPTFCSVIIFISHSVIIFVYW